MRGEEREEEEGAAGKEEEEGEKRRWMKDLMPLAMVGSQVLVTVSHHSVIHS